MPPANRHNPKRATSSQSDYSVTEFLREFPDDEACLEHLWRARHAPDGEHAYCPRCDAEKVFKRYLHEYAWLYNERHRDGRSMFHSLLNEATQR
jgi:hypothetical protein